MKGAKLTDRNTELVQKKKALQANKEPNVSSPVK